MKLALIIGGGFAGQSAARLLARSSDHLRVTLVDRKGCAEFLPLLPDVVGRGLSSSCLQYDLRKAAQAFGFDFIPAAATAIDPVRKRVHIGTDDYAYDFLVVAVGSQPAFFGREDLAAAAWPLYSCAEAEQIRQALLNHSCSTCLVIGGGYTGLELCAQIRRAASHLRVVLVEKGPTILQTLPPEMQVYQTGNLHRLNIEVRLRTSLAQIKDQQAILSTGEVFDQALVIWTAGVRCPCPTLGLTACTPQGRVVVDEYLRFADHAWAVGDAAAFHWKGQPLRQAVQFSITQGAYAARAILNEIAGRSTPPYRPLDLGFIVPMANRRSCGQVLGFPLYGALPTLLHYVMCLYRLPQWSARRALITQLLRPQR